MRGIPERWRYVFSCDNLIGSDLMIVGDRMPGKRYNGFIKSGVVEVIINEKYLR